MREREREREVKSRERLGEHENVLDVSEGRKIEERESQKTYYIFGKLHLHFYILKKITLPRFFLMYQSTLYTSNQSIVKLIESYQVPSWK